ncbi:unnamed protein product [Amoebophrya sp. A25]|nr:unnamed protein product [Amoebophrya sp. A25]|eukprot:GSA25T00003264001.1
MLTKGKRLSQDQSRGIYRNRLSSQLIDTVYQANSTLIFLFYQLHFKKKGRRFASSKDHTTHRIFLWVCLLVRDVESDRAFNISTHLFITYDFNSKKTRFSTLQAILMST